LKSDGTVVAIGDNKNGECDISGWKLFNSLETLENERKEAPERNRIEEIQKLQVEKSALNTELSNLKGLFTGKRRKEIETRLAVIDAQLEKL
jgi:hypothetical protein